MDRQNLIDMANGTQQQNYAYYDTAAGLWYPIMYADSKGGGFKLLSFGCKTKAEAEAVINEMQNV